MPRMNPMRRYLPSRDLKVKTLKNYLGRLNPTSDALFQRPRDGQSKKFNPAVDKIWFCSAPLGTCNYARQHDESDVKASKYRATSHKPLHA